MSLSNGNKARVGSALMLMALCGLAAPMIAQTAPSDKPGTPGTGAPGDPPTPEMMKAMAEKKGGEEGDGLRPFADVSKGFDKVVSTADGKSFYTIWKKDKDGSMLAELPRGFEGQKHFLAMTVASGETYAGLQAGDMYVYWKRFDNRLMLIEPNVDVRSTGDRESKSSVKRLFTDRVVLDVPILSTGPSGQPVIDMKDLLVGRIGTFFGGSAAGANGRLSTIKSAKAFPENVELSFEMPTGRGTLKEFHYSISLIKESSDFQPRVADERTGYFTTVYRDLGKFVDSEKWVRYINRWNIQKSDPKLKLCGPKEPLVYYIEDAVPMRYRRWVREGILEWNKAFEKIGIIDAIQVYQQDASTGANMDKDPEDVRYNFVRWLSNDIGTAIGPSRTNPLTGQILDADVVLTDGWIRHYWMNFNELLPEIAMEGFSAETMSWLETRPQWDPRVVMSAPEMRNEVIANRMRRGVTAYGGHPIGALDPAARAERGAMVGTGEFDGLARQRQTSGLCMASSGKAMDVSMVRMMLDMMGEEAVAAAAGYSDGTSADVGLQPEGDKKDDAKKDEKKEEKKDDKKKKEEPKYDTLDGIPDWFIGPLLRELTAHEVGHTLGLRHNFKASSIYTMAQIASDEVKGKKPFVGSVMDYTPINLMVENGKMQGDVAPIGIGPYDYWVIEYGYTSGDPKDVLKRVAEPELLYGTDEDVGGPDPRAKRYDFAKDPLEYAKSTLKLAKFHRERLLEKYVKDGQSWARARRGYQMTLGFQTRMINMMSSWVGAAYVHRDRKGDPNARPPIDVVPAAQQRDALRWIIDNAFFDEAYGLTPEIVSKMTVDKWMDPGGFAEAAQDETWPIHDRIAGVQTATLTMLMNPTTLRRLYDFEYLTPADKDALTLPEVLDTISNAIWTEVEAGPKEKYTARKPMISSLRRNLQREHVDRLIEISFPSDENNAAFATLSNLARTKLRALSTKIGGLVGDKDGKGKNDSLDAYTAAHLSDIKVRIDKALDASYTLNGGAGAFPSWMFMGQGTGQPEAKPQHP